MRRSTRQSAEEGGDYVDGPWLTSVSAGSIDPAEHERTGADLDLDSSDLTTHGVIVGMTGSGKTGLGIVLIEEVLRSGIPALLIDPKGDLTNLCLTFPDARCRVVPSVDR